MEGFGIFLPSFSDNCTHHIWEVITGTRVLLSSSSSEQPQEVDECFVKTAPNYEGRKQHARRYLLAKFTDLCSALARACNKDAAYAQSDTYLVATVVLREAMDHMASLCAVYNNLLGRFAQVEVAWKNPCEKPGFQENGLGVLLETVRSHESLLGLATKRRRFGLQKHVHGMIAVPGEETVSQLCEIESLRIKLFCNLIQQVRSKCVSFGQTEEYQHAIMTLVDALDPVSNICIPPERTTCVCKNDYCTWQNTNKPRLVRPDPKQPPN
jgi:hypothetical protein